MFFENLIKLLQLFVQQPQWEINCQVRTMTLRSFIETSRVSDSDEWLYFDYKYAKEWFRDNQEVLNSHDWSSFGIDHPVEESTFWIGNRGAHTNCHQDTYGSNLVVQISGR